MNLHLDADRVLLSACNTAGAEGLTRCGALGTDPGILASWRHIGPSRPRRRLRLTIMTLDNDAGEPSLGKAEALWYAQLALIDDPKTAHPIFWAPFVLVGEGRCSTSPVVALTRE